MRAAAGEAVTLKSTSVAAGAAVATGAGGGCMAAGGASFAPLVIAQNTIASAAPPASATPATSPRRPADCADCCVALELSAELAVNDDGDCDGATDARPFGTLTEPGPEPEPEPEPDP